MDRRTRHSTRLQTQDSDPESEEEDPTLSGGLLEISAEGLEQLRQVATEIIEGAAHVEQSDREEEQDDEDDARYATENMVAIESSEAGGCGETGGNQQGDIIDAGSRS